MWINNYIIKRYLNNASLVGDMESYWYFGEAVGYKQARRSLSFWTKKVKRIVKPLSPDERVSMGGYGNVPERFKC